MVIRAGLFGLFLGLGFIVTVLGGWLGSFLVIICGGLLMGIAIWIDE